VHPWCHRPGTAERSTPEIATQASRVGSLPTPASSRRSCAARFSRSPDGTVFPGLAGRHGVHRHTFTGQPARREALTVTSGRYHEAGNRVQIRVWDSDVVGKTPQQIAADEHVARPMMSRIISRCLTHPAQLPLRSEPASQPSDLCRASPDLAGDVIRVTIDV
jgi:hypothetical protein